MLQLGGYCVREIGCNISVGYLTHGHAWMNRSIVYCVVYVLRTCVLVITVVESEVPYLTQQSLDGCHDYPVLYQLMAFDYVCI